MILNSPQSPFLSPSIPLFATNHPHQGQCNSVEEEKRVEEGESKEWNHQMRREKDVVLPGITLYFDIGCATSPQFSLEL